MKKWFSQGNDNSPVLYNDNLWGFGVDRYLDKFLSEPFLELEKRNRSFPKMDVINAPDKVIIKAEVPGMDKKDIKLRIEDNHLYISGEKSEEEKYEKKDMYHIERSFGSFARAVQLPRGIKTQEVKASYRNGVLTVNIPKTEEEKDRARDIDID